MTEFSDKPNAELEQLADKLDQHAVKFAKLTEPAISCWISNDELKGSLIDVDPSRKLDHWETIKTREDQPGRMVWLYRDDSQSAQPLVELLVDLGADFAQLGEDVKAIVYAGWCKHFLPDHDKKIAFVIEALFPGPSLLATPSSQFAYSKISECVKVYDFPGRSSEIHVLNLAKAAAHLAKVLGERLRSNPEPLFRRTEGPDCCSVGMEEERRRPKQAEEILSNIQKIKATWQWSDGPYNLNPQQALDDLWADVSRLSLPLQTCPTLPLSQPIAIIKDSAAHKEIWRTFQGALSEVENIVKASLGGGIAGDPAPDEAGTVLDGEADDASASLSETVKGDESEVEDHSKQLPEKFDGGNMVFFDDRVELCGVDICSGSRSKSRRIVLDLLCKTRSDGSFESYDTEQLEAEVTKNGGKGSAAGLIRDLRKSIGEALKNKANLIYDPKDIVLSGGQGYRLHEEISIGFRNDTPSDQPSS